ncbi:MFS transporter [Streptomyces alkaliterrae]|uniref:MFS transporter n=1 Tax=Streptomyces alkaliterrae TaxID=2213162 RepID=A0A5P0YS40_9ACTN|nr:MFS transporter [Streptomyces alkaliterrae]MBB1261580.1 MFS transporter [Streptomyces alkaliterrae]MQS03105.1 MFS transporter [Streptomyces alkaliterrae]
MGATPLSDRGPGRPRGLVRALGRAVRRPPAAVARKVRKATHAQGAGESGLGKLIELHAVNSAGDMLITIALASTIFFSVPTAEARGRVALYLAITMAPFVLLAPVIGPLLDRLPHGRRAAMAAAMLARALLALALAGAIATGGLELYPEALGVLVASKAYGVVRSAVVPRLLPPRISLVKANSRVTLAGLIATGLAAPIGAGLHQLGPQWPLYAAMAVFVLGTFLSFTLPHSVDSAKGERRAQLAAAAGEPEPWLVRHTPGHGRRAAQRPGLRTVGASVLNALVANAHVRMLSGFLTFFLAFLLREHPFPGMTAAFSLGLVVVAAGAGNALGTIVGAWVKGRAPEVNIVVVMLLTLTVAVGAALLHTTVAVAVLAGTAGLCQALGKLSLDALIQRDVPEIVRPSAFARSETLMQMSWVVGGAVGISLPLFGTLGLSVAALIVAAGTLATIRALLTAARRGTPHPRVA